MKRIFTFFALVLGLGFATIKPASAQIAVFDGSNYLSNFIQQGLDDSQLSTVMDQLTTLNGIQSLNTQDLAQTTGIMNTLGTAQSFFSSNGSLMSQLQSLSPGLNLFSPGANGGLSSFQQYLSPLTNISSMIQSRIGSLFNIGGSVGGNPLSMLQGLSTSQMADHSDDVTSATASLWNQKILGDAQDNATAINDFEQRNQALEQAAQGAQTLQGQQAVSNQLGLEQSDQLNQQANMIQQDNVAAAATRQADLQIRQRQMAETTGSQYIESGDY